MSFHAVSFGPEGSSTYLRRMADIALDVQNNAPRDPLAPATATVLSSYTQALDTVRANISWFLGYMYTNQLSVTLGATRADVPGYCRIATKAERGTDALRWIFWRLVCDVASPVHLNKCCRIRMMVYYIVLFDT